MCIAFQPANVLGVPVTARLVAVLKEQDHFLREYIEVSVPKQQADSLTLDSLDLLSFHVQQGQKTWSRPEMKPANISGFHMGLGQPVYLGSLFLGCEFPAADTRIEDATARTRYYSGKTFSRLKKTQGVFLSWPAVLGVARSDDKEVLQSDFFRYIETISTKTEFRKQYNSWYDHMLDITSENIVGSFYEMEKGLTQHGVAPMDAYVVDDGWNDYTKGFWCFNDKFPQELYPSAALAKKFASNFGLWLGHVEVIRLTRRDSPSIFKRPVRVSETPSRMISAWRLLFISRELKSSFLILCSGLISITGSWMVSPCDPAQKRSTAT